MGIYDREYYRHEQTPGFHLGGHRMMVTNLIIINAAVFVITMFSGRLANSLALDADLFRGNWKVWQLLTYGFLHSLRDVWHILWNMFALYIFGRDVEMRYGRSEFLRIYLVLVVFSGFVWLAVQNLTGAYAYDPVPAVVGASGAVLGILILFCMNFPHRTILLFFVLPVPAWLVAVMYVVFDIVALSPQAGFAGRVAHEAHLGGAALAAAYYIFHWNFGVLGSFWPRKTPSVKKLFKPQPKLKVHHPDEQYDDLDTKGDEILKKLHEYGEESLTSKEKKILHDYSRRMKQKHR